MNCYWLKIFPGNNGGGCFQRNVLTVLEQVYDKSLAYVQTLPFDSKDSFWNHANDVANLNLALL